MNHSIMDYLFYEWVINTKKINYIEFGQLSESENDKLFKEYLEFWNSL